MCLKCLLGAYFITNLVLHHWVTHFKLKNYSSCQQLKCCKQTFEDSCSWKLGLPFEESYLLSCERYATFDANVTPGRKLTDISCFLYDARWKDRYRCHESNTLVIILIFCMSVEKYGINHSSLNWIKMYCFTKHSWISLELPKSAASTCVVFLSATDISLLEIQIVVQYNVLYITIKGGGCTEFSNRFRCCTRFCFIKE